MAADGEGTPTLRRPATLRAQLDARPVGGHRLRHCASRDGRDAAMGHDNIGMALHCRRGLGVGARGGAEVVACAPAQSSAA